MSTEALLKAEVKPNKLHYLALAAVTFGKLGESVEFMLPAVITQPVSCELGLTPQQEHLVALAQYISAAVFSLVSVPFLQRFPRRPIILFSLYLAVASAVLCAVVPEYVSLLLSRILVGITISTGMSPLSVYMAEYSPHKKFYVLSTVAGTLGWTVGGGWCGILGYLLMERVGWRWFVLLTSVPLFIPSILAFQCFLPETLSSNKTINNPDSVRTSRKSMISRIVKLTIINAIRGFPCYGSMLLVPAILKVDNIRNSRGGPCNTIHGEQFLAVTLVFGLSHLLGNGVSYIIHYLKIPSAVKFTVLSVVTTASFILTLAFDDNTMLIITALCVGQFAMSAYSLEITILSYDAYFFTRTFLPISCGLRMAVDYLNSIFANSVSELLYYTQVLKIFTAVSAGMFFGSLLFFKKD